MCATGHLWNVKWNVKSPQENIEHFPGCVSWVAVRATSSASSLNCATIQTKTRSNNNSNHDTFLCSNGASGIPTCVPKRGGRERFFRRDMSTIVLQQFGPLALVPRRQWLTSNGNGFAIVTGRSRHKKNFVSDDIDFCPQCRHSLFSSTHLKASPTSPTPSRSPCNEV